MPCAGARAEIGDLRFDLGEAELIGVAQHRHDQAALGADGDADVVVVLVDDVLAVDLGIDRRNFLQRLHGGFDEEAHEAELDAVLLLEGFAIILPELHHRAHIHVVERGEHGGGVLRLLQPLGDGQAQPRHAHALLARGVVRCERRAGRGRRFRLRLALQQRLGGVGDARNRRGGTLGEHVRLQHLAAAARAFHVVRA